MTLALDPDIPRIKADAGQLEQVVVNLVINARDAMPGGGHLTLTTSPYAGDRDPASGCAREYVRLTIADTGCGIPPDTRSKVFDPFFTTKGAAGAGLGLATVYGIVMQNGGRIDLDSTVGVGTTFIIDLPATSETSPVAELSAAPPGIVDGYARVLIVEDDPGVRQIVEIVLRRAGHDVVAVEGPQEALAFLSGQSDINLVLTDVVMPEMNGYELAAEIQKIAPGARIVFMSGYAHDTSRQPVDDPFLRPSPSPSNRSPTSCVTPWRQRREAARLGSTFKLGQDRGIRDILAIAPRTTRARMRSRRESACGHAS